MARTFKRKESLQTLSDLNVTPLMDLAFSLLIIFMVSTPLLEQTIPLELPKQEENADSKRQEDIDFQLISVDCDGVIYWGDLAVSKETLDEKLKELSLKEEPPVLSIRGQGKGVDSYQNIIDIINAIKKHKLTKISLDTRVTNE